MAKDIERISVNKFESALAEDDIVTETLYGTEDVTIQIKRTLPLPEMVSFVQEVVEACVDMETGDYVPEAYDFAIRVGVLTHYANFAMPANTDKQYWLVYNTRAFKQVINHINEYQFNDIIRTIDKKIQFMLDVISSTAFGKINEVITKFGEIAEVGAKAFGGADAGDIAGVIENISKVKGMDEAKLAKILLDRQSEPDKSADTVEVKKE